MHDDLQVFYDYSGQTGYLFNATPLRETIADETLGLSAVPTVVRSGSMRRSADAGNAFAAELPLRPSSMRFSLRSAKEHLHFVRRMNAAIKEAR
jgi:hypothetical protein